MSIKMLAVSCMLLGMASSVTGGPGQTEYYNLESYLFTGYRKNVRPTTAGEATTVFLNLKLKSIVDLDEREQVLSVFVTLKVAWNDDYMTWTPALYGNITRILYPQKELWTPDIVHENSVESQTQLGYDQLVLSVSNEGTVRWNPSEILKTSCDIDVTFYPFDTQICFIDFTTVLSTKDEVDIDAFIADSLIDLSDFSPSATWELVDTGITEPPDTGTGVSRIIFQLKLKRLRQYYILNIILPLLLLSLTASTVFYLPADAGEKIGMSITVLLAFAVYLTIINDETPKSSRQISILSVYLICLLGVTTMSVIFSIVVLHNHHKGEEIPISPRLVRWTRKARRFLGLNPVKLKTPSNKVEPSSDKRVFHDVTMKTRPDSDDRRERIKRRLRLLLKGDDVVSRDNIDVEEPPEDEVITWQKIAETMDRIFFLSFTFLIAALTLVTLPVMLIWSAYY